MGRKDSKRREHFERSRKRKERKKKKQGNRPKPLRAKRKRLPSSTRPVRAVRAVEYYHEAFAHIRQTLQRQGYSLGPSPKRQSFWQFIPPGRYQSNKAREYLDAYLQSVEATLREVLGRYSLAYWHHVYRRFPPTPVGDDQSPTTIQITRAVLDAAIQKYAKTELCSRIAISNQVDPTSILNGFLVESGAKTTLRSLAANPELVLTSFGPDEYREALQTEKLAYEIWRTMAQRRIVGKGAPLVVADDGDGVWVTDDRDDDLDFLVTHFDNREASFCASATGTVFAGDLDQRGEVLMPQWNTSYTSYESLRPIFTRMLGSPVATPEAGIGPNFVLGFFNIGAYYRAHAPFSEPFRNRNDVSLESVIAVIAALFSHLYFIWKRMPIYSLRMWERAYDVPGKPTSIKRWINEFVPIAIESNHLPFDKSVVDVEAAFDYLSLHNESRSQIDVAYGGPHAVFIPNGTDQVFIDYANLLSRLNYLFFDVKPDDQNFKGAALEAFTHRGASVLPTGELHAPNGTSKQIDAAFDLDSTLVICECRAVGRSLAVEKGDPRALDFRQDLIERTLTDVDKKGTWLRSNPVGSNYDVRRYESILPLGVTPFKEFIHSRSARYWVDDDLPRVLNPDELRDAIDDGSLRAAISRSPNRLTLR